MRYHFEPEPFGHGIFITSGGTSQLENIHKPWNYNTDQLVACFDRVTSPDVNKDKFFADLIDTFYVMYGINLYLVVFDASHCNVIEPHNQTLKNPANSGDSEKFALLFIRKELWRCYSIFIQHNDGTRQTIFSRADLLTWFPWSDFLEYRNLPGERNLI